MRKTVLVTGGAGAIGSYLVRTLCKKYQVLVLDDLSSGFIENLRGSSIKFWRGSIVDDEILKEVFAEHPSVVFHLAANFANQNSVDYPQKDLSVNGMGTLKLLQYAREIGVERFVYTSSSCVYGNINEPISEYTHNYSLDTPYAVTKLLGEQYVNFFHKHHAIPTVILRLFNSHGPGEYPGKYRNVIPNFMYRVLKELPIVITGTGEETRDFTYVSDIVQALLLALTENDAVGEVFNVGTGVETSIQKLAESISQICSKKALIEYKPRRNWDSISRRRADISHIQSVLNYKPKVDLYTGLDLTYQWFVENKIANFEPI